MVGDESPASADLSEVSLSDSLARMTERKSVDWEAIEREYRAGQLSVREIARTSGVTETAIRKHAKADGWTRALSEKVREAVREKLVRSDGSQSGSQSPRDAEIIDMAAARGVEVVRQHRATLSRAHRIVADLLEELQSESDYKGEIEEDILVDRADDKTSGRRNRMLKAISLPTRAGTALALGQALRALVPLERQAFALDAEVPTGKYTISDRPMSNDEWADRYATPE
jgi:predicted transcriptional regulator